MKCYCEIFFTYDEINKSHDFKVAVGINEVSEKATLDFESPPNITAKSTSIEKHGEFKIDMDFYADQIEFGYFPFAEEQEEDETNPVARGWKLQVTFDQKDVALGWNIVKDILMLYKM